MKANYKFFAALLAMVLFAAAAYAQQPARRGSGTNSREEAKVERQQTKVDKGQKPTNIDNQNATDKKVRDAQGDRGGFGGNGNRPSGNGGFDNGNRPSGDRPSGNGGFGGNNDRPSNNGGYSGNRPSSDRPSGNGNSGNGNRPSGNGGFDNGNRPPMPPSGNGNNGNFGNGNRPPMPPAGFDERGRRPEMSPIIKYSRTQIYERTNASSIVVGTSFRSKQEAYDYIEWLLDQKAYTIGTYGNNYNWIQSEVAFVPTPFDWTNPMTHNQFRMKFYITRSAGIVKVTITAQWRESFLSDSYTKLRFQPSDRYSTYYAWNVLEDFASSIPHSYILYR